MDSETPLNVMQRVTMGYTNGILTLNQCLDALNLPAVGKEGDKRQEESDGESVGELPTENSQPGAKDIATL